ncbi:hypothetical protein BH11PAT1_BH11PAT1_5620 [soil metagenome]
MIKSILVILGGLVIGLGIGYFFFFLRNTDSITKPLVPFLENTFSKKQIIGFLPYWLLSKGRDDYSPYINTLTYFGLTVDIDGKILTHTNQQESEPGWYALESGKADVLLQKARENKQTLSLLVFAGNEASISALMEDPIPHAQNLVADITPLMKRYNFTDLNLDIESVKSASDEARIHFTQFVKEVKKGMDKNKLETLTIDITSDSLVKKRLINLPEIADFIDIVVIMAYDYHYSGSLVTGPVAPLFGAGTESEYDTQAAVQTAVQYIPAKKIVLGIPNYGYEWETLRDTQRAATIPSSGLTASTQRIENLKKTCASCSARIDETAKESSLSYKDTTGSFHQLFYPDASSTTAKIDFARNEKLGGIAVWALGYEDTTILNPLSEYK